MVSWNGLIFFFWRDPIDLKFYSLIQRVFLMRLEHSDLINVTGGFVLYRYTRGYDVTVQMAEAPILWHVVLVRQTSTGLLEWAYIFFA